MTTNTTRLASAYRSLASQLRAEADNWGFDARRVLIGHSIQLSFAARNPIDPVVADATIRHANNVLVRAWSVRGIRQLEAMLNGR